MVVSPSFTGPALIRRVVLIAGTSSGLPLTGFQMYKSLDNAGAGSNLASTVIVSGQKIWDPMSISDDTGAVLAEADTGVPMTSKSALGDLLPIDLDIAVTDSKFYLKIKITQNAAGAWILDGYVHVIENLTPEQLATFL